MNEEAGLFELGDLVSEREPPDDVPGVRGEGQDVGRQVVGEVVRIALELLEVELGDVVEADFGSPVQDGLWVLDPGAIQGLCLLPGGLLRIGEDTVGSPEDREGEDYLSVVSLLVVTPEEVGHRSEERGDLGKVREGLYSAPLAQLSRSTVSSQRCGLRPCCPGAVPRTITRGV